MTLLPVRAAAALLLLAAVSACGKVQAKLPAPMPALDMPSPPGRLIVPSSIPEPTPEPTPTPIAPPPAKPKDPPPTTRPERPSPTPTPTPDAAPPAAPPVLQTTSSSTELERLESNAKSQLLTAQRDLDRVNYRGLNSDAKLQYDTARQYIGQAEDALRIKNYVFASQLADKAAVLASLLVKSRGRNPTVPTFS